MAHYLEDLGGVVVLPVYIICKRPFFANKNVTFAKLSRIPRLSVAGPMLGNNASYEDSFTACQITPENHGSLLDSPLNMQLASRNPFSGQIAADYSFFARFTDPLPSTSSTCTLTFARSFARLSQNFRENIRIHRPLTPAISRGRIEGKASTRGLGVWLSQSLTFGNLAAAFGACFLRLQEASLGSDSGRCKDALQDHAWCLAVA